ncbi:hypothetical protein [Nonomuraea sp. NPDC049480]|uniref:hypothetical protein n=1 Tax=Nonomuraea sp. NPDC049480 TaxID=3364353 RepID=UPI00378DDE2D
MDVLRRGRPVGGRGELVGGGAEADRPDVAQAVPGCGPRLVEVVTDRAHEAAFHARVRAEMARILPGLPA